jgi:hypothetical protein
MKFLISVALLAGFCSAQAALPATARVFVINPNGAVQFVMLDPAALAIVNGVLTVIKAPALPVLGTRVVEITQVAVATPTYTLGQTPNATAPELDVFWNGLVLSVGIDYTVAANVVTFTVGPGPGDVLRVVYRGT